MAFGDNVLNQAAVCLKYLAIFIFFIESIKLNLLINVLNIFVCAKRKTLCKLCEVEYGIR